MQSLGGPSQAWWTTGNPDHVDRYKPEQGMAVLPRCDRDELRVAHGKAKRGSDSLGQGIENKKNGLPSASSPTSSKGRKPVAFSSS
jgi:hypothetical protein